MLGILENPNSGNVVVELRKGKMRGGKEEEKKMDPIFPRLHINDAERGGPRAPPRNKMALSEQPAVSLPPQRLNPDLPSISMLPLPPANSPTSIPGPSSSHAGSTEKMFPPFCYPPGSSHWTGMSHPYSSGIHFAAGEPSFATPRNPPDVAPMASLNYQCFSVKGHLPSSECIPFQPCNLPYSSNSFSGVKLGNGGDFSVPAFHQIGKHLSCGNVQQNGDKEKDTFSSSNSYQKFRCSSEKETGGELKLGEHEHPTYRVKENLDMNQTRKHHAAKEPSFVPSTREKSLINVDSSSVARTRSEFQDECRVLQENKANGDGEYEKSAKKRSASMMEDLSCSLRPPGDEKRRSNGIEFVNKCPDEPDHGSFQAGDADRNEETSDASAVNSTSVVNLSPNDIVRMLGQKLFWKARRTILHQQRIFVLQIFELHRLIKVQRMVARSPEILFEDNMYTSKPAISKKNLLSDNAQEPRTLVVEPKADSERPEAIMGGGADKTSEKTLPVCNDTHKRHSPQQANQSPYPGMPALGSPAPEAKSGPWCFQPPPGNQWLVPVRSPSEGLVYKPYSGPCPPPGGILAPLYGGCRPLNLSGVGGNYLNTPYGMVTSNQPGIGIFSTPPVSQAYFQPYPMPVMNPSGSTSAIDLLSPFARARSSPWEIVPSIRDNNNTPSARPYEKSCNISSQKSGIVSNGAQSLQTDRGSDLQGSTASSPSERDALSLFPTTPATDANQIPEQRIQVIKVVPHNPNTAPESAARIFKSIQEERKQH
nr:protein HEADING DATE 3B-like isoform X1 [Ipomoea batatas]